MSKGCGFCRDVRLFFSLLKQHTKNFYDEFVSYREVCEIAQDIKPLPPFPVTKTVQDIRKAASKNFRNPEPVTITPEKLSDPFDWVMSEDGKTMYIVPKT